MKYYDYKDVYNKELRINERITTVKDQNRIFPDLFTVILKSTLEPSDLGFLSH